MDFTNIFKSIGQRNKYQYDDEMLKYVSLSYFERFFFDKDDELLAMFYEAERPVITNYLEQFPDENKMARYLQEEKSILERVLDLHKLEYFKMVEDEMMYYFMACLYNDLLTFEIYPPHVRTAKCDYFDINQRYFHIDIKYLSRGNEIYEMPKRLSEYNDILGFDLVFEVDWSRHHDNYIMRYNDEEHQIPTDGRVETAYHFYTWVNEVLAHNNSDVRLYPLFKSDEGGALFLTKEQKHYFDNNIYLSKNATPDDVETWYNR